MVRRGRAGGVALGRAPEAITLGDVYKTVERDVGVLSLRGTVSLRCPVARGMEVILPPVFEEASAAVESSLGRTSLAQVLSAIDS